MVHNTKSTRAQYPRTRGVVHRNVVFSSHEPILARRWHNVAVITLLLTNHSTQGQEELSTEMSYVVFSSHEPILARRWHNVAVHVVAHRVEHTAYGRPVRAQGDRLAHELRRKTKKIEHVRLG